ncbi:SHQ1-domain-containing protein [Dendrothele bispora CBS 962.96]|uniref:SHQ1-domain-containing protein n=1 Tax=Dendrothele bispora (strain CBS 962.96) TaxID=1314807 RepID=A0A4S8MBL1_DENBC|nr:SHQ1-domain-containing protein [Dendrothele bispora CBS 962.96]
MITPRFSCSQTAESVIISIYCPSVRASDVEISVDDTLFSLHINPYFLRLNFSHSVVEDDASSAKYDPGSGYLTVTLTKEIKGQEFKDLDLLAKLLAPRPTVSAPSIEVLSTQDTAGDDNDEHELVAQTQKLSLEQKELLEAVENDWQLLQEVPAEEPIKLSSRVHYGFLDMYSDYFVNVTYTENEVNELGSEAESCSLSERRRKRIKHENEKWDEEHYMADFADDEYIQELISWKHPHVVSSESFQYTEKENMAMLNLPRKEYLPTPIQTHNLYLTLITFLFSYAYESRTNQHDPTPESAWTICSITPCFSALDPSPYNSPSSLDDFTTSELSATLVPSYRRSLAFPLHRSFALSEKCREDVSSFLSRGKRTVFRCLLEMKDILDHHEVYYVYSKIWLDDFCVWTQAYASDQVLFELGSLLRDAVIPKSSIGWDLKQLEDIVRQDMNDENRREPDSDDESEYASSDGDSGSDSE